MIAAGLVFPGLDRLTRLATRLLRLPVSLVTLVEADRQWFASAVGLPEPWASRRSTPLTHSFCQHVVETGGPLIIGDAREHPVLRHNLAIVDLSVIAYAGYPLRAPDGETLGTFCAIDSEPRQWNDEELEVVEEFAGVATAEVAALLSARQLGETADQVRAILDTAQDAFIAVDGVGTITGWNRSAEAMFRWSASEAVGLPAAELLFSLDRRKSQWETLVSAVREPVPAKRLIRLDAVRRHGGEFPVELSLCNTTTGEGEEFYAFVRDISDRVAAEQEAARHAAFLNAVLNSLDVGVVACDEHGRLVLFNQLIHDMYETGPENIGMTHWASRFNLMRPEGGLFDDDELPLVRALRGERVRDMLIMVRMNGMRQLFLANGETIRDSGGRSLGAVISLHDVTERYRAEQFRNCELAVSQGIATAASADEAGQRMLAAVGTNLGWRYAELWLVDETHTAVRSVNRWSADGVPDPVPGPARLGPGEGLVGRVWRDREPGIVRDMGTDPRLADLAVRHNLTTAIAVPVCSGDEALGVLAIFTDVSDDPLPALRDLLSDVAAHVGQFLERRHAEELAVRLAHAKDDFVSLVGHELRTPLTSIGSIIGLILDDPRAVSPDVNELLTMVQRNCSTLRDIVDDLLDLAGLESGHITMRTVRVDLAELAGTVVDAFRSVARQRDLTITTEVMEGVAVQADPVRLRQVLDNLLANAVKYTPEGGRVYVEVGRRGENCQIVVADNGPGVVEHERPHLFERFYRSSAVRAQGIPGTGLGLAVTRTIVERHGGTIRVEDNSPGTRFTVTLPVDPVPAGPAPVDTAFVAPRLADRDGARESPTTG